MKSVRETVLDRTRQLPLHPLAKGIVVRLIMNLLGVDLVRSLAFPKELTVKKNGIYFVVNPRRNYFFWKAVEAGRWETRTFEIFNEFLDKKHSYIDIGAWIGPTVLYGSLLAKHCYAVEPDPVAFQELRDNVQLNKDLVSRITLSNLALSNRSGTIHLFQHGWSGSSLSTILSVGTRHSKRVKATTFPQFIEDNSITDCNFIKMDIEGGEYILLPTMFDYLKANKPTLLLELHPMPTGDMRQGLETIRKLQSIYDHLLNDELKEIGVESLPFSEKRTIHVVLSET